MSHDPFRRENLAVGVVEDDGLTAVASGHDMVGGVLIFDPGGSGHEEKIMERERRSNSKF